MRRRGNTPIARILFTIARFLRRESPATRIVAVDALGSVALGGRPEAAIAPGG